MTIIQSAVFLSIIILLLVLIILFVKNNKLQEELKHLEEILILKNKTIENYKKSRVAVKEVLENISLIEQVLPLIEEKESKRIIADKFKISLTQVEMIIKLDKLKKSN